MHAFSAFINQNDNPTTLSETHHHAYAVYTNHMSTETKSINMSPPHPRIRIYTCAES